MSSEVDKRPNSLINEKSPYLRQHAYNPVQWYPWGEEAFKKAKELNRPIFLSVGYSTCHWCHVMEHESFEDETIGKYLNDNFVSIKVDREERPDVDKLYMSFIQAISGGGGWPMSVFLTPNLEPITGGTYFPPADSFGRPGFLSVLKMISDKWTNRQAELKQQGQSLAKAIREGLKQTMAGNVPNAEVSFEKCYEHFSGEFDEANGGFGSAPKFPQPVNLDFLLAYHSTDQSSTNGKRALEMVQKTLQKMTDGGIHDHVGKGFHRYSVDSTWHVPHFEKMLYDQGQLLSTYSNFYKLSGVFKETIEDIADYIRSNLSHTLGGFFSAEDADSHPTHDAKKKKEGAFCVWTKREIEEVLENRPARHNENITLDEIFCKVFNVLDSGNVPSRADPHGELTNQNILKSIDPQTLENYAKECRMSREKFLQCINDAKGFLRERRSQRPPPHLDNKFITSWNGLAISGFCAASSALGRSDYRERAEKAVEFVRKYLMQDGHLLRSAYVSETDGGVVQIASPIKGFADDYAFFIQALLDLYELNFDDSLLALATDLQAKMDDSFWDKENNSGYYLARDDDPSIFARMQEEQDGAEPSTNSVAVSNLLRLAALANDNSYRQRAENCFKGCAARLGKHPYILSKMLISLRAYFHSPPQIIILGKKSDEVAQSMVALAQAKFYPLKMLVFIDTEEKNLDRWLLQHNSHVKSMVDSSSSSGNIGYVCRNFSCDLPARTLEELKSRLDSL
ncbi:thioredoxin-like domain-containing protein [Ditylenchus destructor]|nr:thioredoxin-like domain-containing protein [Ditylenchus destructor]